MLRYFLAILLAFCAIGCNDKNKDETTSRYYEDGRAKPIVAIPPMMDSTSYDIPWSLSEEFTSLVHNRLARKGSMFLPSPEEMEVNLSPSQNPFDANISWIKNTFKGNEFVVFLELIEHDNEQIGEPKKTGEAATNLNMAVRIRILDIRGEKPKIILQEKIVDSYYLSKNLFQEDYNRTVWGSADYNTTPLAMAHIQLAKEIIGRINDYITLAKSR